MYVCWRAVQFIDICILSRCLFFYENDSNISKVSLFFKEIYERVQYYQGHAILQLPLAAEV